MLIKSFNFVLADTLAMSMYFCTMCNLLSLGKSHLFFTSSYPTLLATIGLELGDRSRTILFQSFIGLKVRVPYTPPQCGWSPGSLGNTANTDSIRQAKEGSLTVDPIPTLETNKQTHFFESKNSPINSFHLFSTFLCKDNF